MPNLHLKAETVNKLSLVTSGQVLYRDTKLQGFGLRVGLKTKAYFVERRVDGRTVRTTIGIHGPMTADEARRNAMEALGKMSKGADLNAEKRVAVASRGAARADAKAIAAHTLERLLTAYCDHLKAIGRPSHKDARSIFNLHVIAAWPAKASMPAKSVTAEDFSDMMRRLIDAGKGRTANKLRSYARAAYQTAKAARSKPSIPVAFKAYEITANPLAETEPDESQNRADKNPMSAAELRAYWQIIKPLPGFKGALLRLHLLTGGQRIEQLVNLQTSNIEPGSILLHDGKGRPGRPPRPHTIPLTKEAAKALAACEPAKQFALSTDGGATHVAATTLSDWAVEVARSSIDGFQAKRVRSGVETLLASAGVSQDIRGRLQSHGIAGVQARHYDGHDYMDEKRKALETLYKLLEQPAATNVTPIKRKRA